MSTLFLCPMDIGDSCKTMAVVSQCAVSVSSSHEAFAVRFTLNAVQIQIQKTMPKFLKP